MAAVTVGGGSSGAGAGAGAGAAAGAAGAAGGAAASVGVAAPMPPPMPPPIPLPMRPFSVSSSALSTVELDPWQTFASHREMRVLVVRVGRIPDEKFEGILALFRECGTEIAYAEIDPEGKGRGALPRRDWRSARIRMRFETVRTHDASSPTSTSALSSSLLLPSSSSSSLSPPSPSSNSNASPLYPPPHAPARGTPPMRAASSARLLHTGGGRRRGGAAPSMMYMSPTTALAATRRAVHFGASPLDWITKMSKGLVVDPGRRLPEQQAPARPGSPLEHWGAFQGHRRVLGVIGVALCPMFVDLNVAAKEFRQQVDEFRHLAIHGMKAKCFAFEPLPEQPDFERGSEFILIPDGTAEQLRFYVQTQLIDFCAMVLKTLESAVNDAATSERKAYIDTLLDKPPVTADAVTRLKHLSTARHMKCKGDYCLISGSPADALTFYDSALDLLKGNQDWIWVGGCLEGIVAATVLGAPPPPRGSRTPVSAQIAELARESMASFAKPRRHKGLTLWMEFAFKIARLYVDTGAPRNLVNDLLADVADRIALLPPSLRPTVAGAISSLYGSLGWRRKAGFFLKETAHLHARSALHRVAHELLRCAAASFQLDPLAASTSTTWFSLSSLSSSSLSSSSSSSSSPTALSSSLPPTVSCSSFSSPLSPPPPPPPPSSSLGQPSCLLHQRPAASAAAGPVRVCGWPRLQVDYLSRLLHVAKATGDHAAVARYAAFFLSRLAPFAPHALQLAYREELLAAARELPHDSAGPAPALFFDGLVAVHSIEHVRPPPESQPVHVSRKKTSTVFVYSPFQDRRKKGEGERHVYCVEGEILRAEVVVSKPTALSLEVKEFKLCTVGAGFLAFPTTVLLPANTRRLRVTLAGTALSAGSLSVVGCSMRLHGAPVSFADRGFSVRVVPALPLLAPCDAAACSSLAVRSGEALTRTVRLLNIGSVPVEFVRARLHEHLSDDAPAPSRYELDERPEVCAVDMDALQARLPLPPGQVAPVHLRITGTPHCTGVTVTFTYGRREVTAYEMQLAMGLRMHVERGLEVVGFDILSLTSEDEHRREGCFASCYVMNPTGTPFELLCRSAHGPLPAAAEGVLGAPMLFPSDPHSTKQVLLPLAYFSLNPAALPPVPVRGQFVKAPDDVSEAEVLEQRMLYWYKSELKRRISITWQNTLHNICGTLDIFPRVLPLTMEMLSRLRGNPIVFEPSAGERELRVGVFCPLHCVLRNAHFEPLTVSVILQFYAGVEAGSEEGVAADLAGAVVWMGSPRTVVRDLRPGGTYTAELLVCPLEEGVFRFRCRCKDLASGFEHSSAPLQVKAVRAGVE